MTKAVWNGAVIADSDDVVVVDGYTYFPEDSVVAVHLVPSTRTSVCAWKGQASYYDIVVDGRVNGAAAWYYASPKRGAEVVGGRIGFWRGVEIVRDTDIGENSDATSSCRSGLFGDAKAS